MLLQKHREDSAVKYHTVINDKKIKKLECTDNQNNIILPPGSSVPSSVLTTLKDIKHLQYCDINLDVGYIKFNKPEYFTYDAVKEAVTLLYTQHKSFHFTKSFDNGDPLNFFLCLTNIRGEDDFPGFYNYYPFTRVDNQWYSSNLISTEKYPTFVPCSVAFFGNEPQHAQPMICGKQYYESLREGSIKSFIRSRIGEFA